MILGWYSDVNHGQGQRTLHSFTNLFLDILEIFQWMATLCYSPIQKIIVNARLWIFWVRSSVQVTLSTMTDLLAFHIVISSSNRHWRFLFLLTLTSWQASSYASSKLRPTEPVNDRASWWWWFTDDWDDAAKSVCVASELAVGALREYSATTASVSKSLFVFKDTL